MEDMDRTATWNAVGPKLVERIRAQNTNEGVFDNHSIAYGLRHPDDSEEHQAARDEFLEKIEGMSPVGHSKTYGPLIGRIFANGHSLQFGEDDEAVRHAVDHYHQLKQSGVFDAQREHVPAKFNNPSALRNLDDLHEIANHPVIQQHESTVAQQQALQGNHKIVWEGQDKHGVTVRAFEPGNVHAARELYGVGKNGVKAEFPGGVGWCTVNPSNFDHYSGISRRSGNPLLIFKREGEDHPFAQMHVDTGQLHGALPKGAEPDDVKTQKSRMANRGIFVKDFDDYLPGFDARGHFDKAYSGRQQRADAGNARNMMRNQIRNSTDEELAAHAQHEDPEYRRVAVDEAGDRGLQQILAVAVDDPDRTVARVALAKTPDAQMHKRFARPASHPQDKLALASNHHLSSENAIKLFNVSQPPNHPREDAWIQRLDTVQDNQWATFGEMHAVARQLMDRKVPYRRRPGEEYLPERQGTRQTYFRRSPNYQDVLSHVATSFMDNAHPHIAGPRDPKTGKQTTETPIEAASTNEAEISRHVARAVGYVTNESLNEKLINRVERLGTKIPVSYDDLNQRLLAQRGYRTSHFLRNGTPLVQAAAVVGTYPVVEANKMAAGGTRIYGGNKWDYKVKHRGNVFKKEIIDVARAAKDTPALMAMLGHAKKWSDLRGVLADKAKQFDEEYQRNDATAHAGGSELAAKLASQFADSDDYVAHALKGHGHEQVVKSVALLTKNPDIRRELSSHQYGTVRAGAFHGALKHQDWPLVHDMLNRGDQAMDPTQKQWAERHEGYQEWKRSQNDVQQEALQTKQSIKQRMLLNVGV